jgi:hypothetical protein
LVFQLFLDEFQPDFAAANGDRLGIGVSARLSTWKPFNAVPGVIVHANQLSLIRLGTSARESSILERWFLTVPDTRRRALARAPRRGAGIADVRLFFHVTTL